MRIINVEFRLDDGDMYEEVLKFIESYKGKFNLKVLSDKELKDAI